MSSQPQGSINYQTGAVDLTFPNAPIGPVAASYSLFDEPSAVDRLAAIEDPEGEAAKRVKQWEELSELQKNILKVSDEVYKRTIRKPSTMLVHPQVAHTILGGVEVTC